MQKVDFERGNKIRDIKNDTRSQQILLGVVLFVFDVLLLVGLVVLILNVNSLVVYIISPIVFIGCLAYSFVSLIRSHSKFGYILYENCIYFNSVFEDGKICFKDVLTIKKCVTFLDKIFNRGTETIIITKINHTKAKMFFITEDADALMEEIENLRKK